MVAGLHESNKELLLNVSREVVLQLLKKPERDRKIII
jgi:hypothetical protein